MATFAEALHNLRKENGLTQKELGSAAGISQITISRFESGIRLPNRASLEALTRALNDTSGTITAAWLQEVGSAPASDPLPPLASEALNLFRQLKKEDQKALLRIMTALAGKQEEKPDESDN